MAVIRFTDEADALDKANDTDFGLASYIQTTNLGRAHRMAAELDAGTVDQWARLPAVHTVRRGQAERYRTVRRTRGHP